MNWRRSASTGLILFPYPATPAEGLDREDNPTARNWVGDTTILRPPPGDRCCGRQRTPPQHEAVHYLEIRPEVRIRYVASTTLHNPAGTPPRPTAPGVREEGYHHLSPVVAGSPGAIGCYLKRPWPADYVLPVIA